MSSPEVRRDARIDWMTMDELKAALQQAERERDEWRVEEARAVAEYERLRASVPAFVEDVTTAAYCGAEETVTVEQVQQILRDALTVYEQSQGKP